MDGNLLKKILIAFIILFIILIITILIIKFNNKKNNHIEEQGDNVVENYGKNTSGGIDYNSYFDVKKCMQKYLNNININNSQYSSYDENGNHVHILEENEIKQNILDLLSNKYINENKITVENVYDYVKILQNQCIFAPVETSLIQDGDIKSFLTYGLIESNEDYSLIDKIFAVVNINIHEGNFSIEPINGEYNSIKEIKIEKFENTIISNDENKFFMSHPNADDFPVEYINVYKQLAIGAPEKLYDLLDEEYRNARFGSLNEFENYIKSNKSQIQTIRLDRYKVDVDGTNVKYILIDQNENYYVINQKQILQDYKMLLDIYTIDIPEFIEKYDSSENNIKVALNIEKLIDATKNGDYKYAYNKLDETFKNTNFKTQENFENFIKGKFNAAEDTIKYEKYEKKAGVHVYNIEVTDTSENKNIKAKVVMKLKENRDFVFSFSVEN